MATTTKSSGFSGHNNGECKKCGVFHNSGNHTATKEQRRVWGRRGAINRNKLYGSAFADPKIRAKIYAKRGYTDQHDSIKNDKTIICCECKIGKPLSEYYLRKNKRYSDGTQRYATICKDCNRDYLTRTKIEKKIKAIEYMGGKCQVCGLKGEAYYIYDFHHKNRSEKEKPMKKYLQMGWEKLKKELNKCNLVCAICHRHIEYGDV
ncbi:hypothetical protein LCGC14_2132050, partial [marine sediment metagenome]